MVYSNFTLQFRAAASSENLGEQNDILCYYYAIITLKLGCFNTFIYQLAKKWGLIGCYGTAI